MPLWWQGFRWHENNNSMATISTDRDLGGVPVPMWPVSYHTHTIIYHNYTRLSIFQCRTVKLAIPYLLNPSFYESMSENTKTSGKYHKTQKTSTLYEFQHRNDGYMQKFDRGGGPHPHVTNVIATVMATVHTTNRGGGSPCDQIVITQD